MQTIQGLQTSTGVWITLTEFDPKLETYDAYGWVEKVGNHMSGGTIELPGNGVARIERFDAFRVGPET